MGLEGGAQLSFRSRSTIFTVEDDDQAAERLLVEVVEQGEEDVRVEKDFSLLLYKISEVSQAEGPECLQGDFIKAWTGFPGRGSLDRVPWTGFPGHGSLDRVPWTGFPETRFSETEFQTQ